MNYIIAGSAEIIRIVEKNCSHHAVFPIEAQISALTVVYTGRTPFEAARTDVFIL